MKYIKYSIASVLLHISVCSIVYLFMPLRMVAQHDCTHTLSRYRLDVAYPNIFDISYTPQEKAKPNGFFSDCGAWFGYTMPQRDRWVNGFCGPFSLDKYKWFARSLVRVDIPLSSSDSLVADSTNYYPGGLYLSSRNTHAAVEQRLVITDSTTSLLHIRCHGVDLFSLSAEGLAPDTEITAKDNLICFYNKSFDESVLLQLPPSSRLTVKGDNYAATVPAKEAYLTLTFRSGRLSADSICPLPIKPCEILKSHHQRWEQYISQVLRPDMPQAYNRIAVKCIATLITNWRAPKGDLLHAGVVPSHAAGYFMGFWAWDSWKHAVALAYFHPSLAKEQIKAMFDYQLPDGMVVDCVYADKRENNLRDSKPPLAAWAVNEVYQLTGDVDFVREMYPKLMKYYLWWYQKRDHDGNGICEYGSTDGTREAAAWESGMDNAIRFDAAAMLKSADDAWSYNQESVDLNYYLCYEQMLLKRMAGLLGLEFKGSRTDLDKLSRAFFDEQTGFFYDRRLGSGALIRHQGCEAYTPMWTGLAAPAQVKAMYPILRKSFKFSTYIPFPTVAADNKRYKTDGYWRGSIWLDQTYFAIRGLRNYGYRAVADVYTRQVFDRLQGLQGSSAIYENYDCHSGKPLQAAHFSWSAAHLLMLYHDYGR
ncbi:MGH1-like glycoside hydrolase domain-containing protein [Porphyromonas pogonae]|uniref:MGH1-like glycoside hydrolase domain-containing protein n=1 Tax=Porphyromonas pogonae TaxID=867595 RepID=UPI002E792787|nr:trehalase family glycosidase [Porphyromonas pogonae]